MIVRRQIIGGLGAVAAMSLMQNARASTFSERDVLVLVFLRGGADGLNMLVPYQDARYYEERKPSMGSSVAVSASDVINLDGYFGLHPALAALAPANPAGSSTGSPWADGKLAFVYGVGDPQGSRSHFRNMDRMELANGDHDGQSGWLARYLHAMPPVRQDPLIRAMALHPTTQLSLAGAPGLMTAPNLSGFALGESTSGMAMKDLYAGDSKLSQTAQSTIRFSDALDALNINSAPPDVTKHYPDSDLGNKLKSTGRLIQHLHDLEVVCVDRSGWDRHGNGDQDGMNSILADLGQSLAAFYHDIKTTGRRATVVVMSEFGRRIAANGSGGTDHGSGGLMMLLGEAVQGGIYARTPGPQAGIEGPLWSDLVGASPAASFVDSMRNEFGDLATTTDYRSILGQVLAKRMGIAPDHHDLWDSTFPNFGYRTSAWPDLLRGY